MIYLSCLELDPRSAWARADLQNPYEMHRTLSRAFGDGGEQYRGARCLFRVEERREGWRVLVQSRTEPNWQVLETGRRYLAGRPRVKALDPRFTEKQELRFLLLANPTRRESIGPASETGERRRSGTRRALVFDDLQESERAQREWLERKGRQGGFKPVLFEVEDRGVLEIRKGGERIPYAAIRFEGFLQVTDPAVFRETLENGIGSAKGFGFGLLSLAPGRVR
jgi:CRISPR system Cascade subunit CasE